MKKALSLLLAVFLCFMTFSCVREGKNEEASAQTTLSTPESTPNVTTGDQPNVTTGNPPEEKKEPLLAGFAERDFTPTKMGGALVGGSYLAIAKKVEMPLLTNAAAFESGEESFILLSIDLLRITEGGVTQMRKRINEATGVPEANIMLVATHTHTSVALDIQHNQSPPNPEAYGHMIDMSVEAATEAWNNREPIKFGHGKTTLSGYSFCRDAYMKNGDINTWPSKNNIDRLISEVDKSVDVVRFDDTEGNIKCFIVNYANHPDSSSKQGYNSDYPGYMRDILKQTYGENVTVLYLNGAEGDVNYSDYLGKGTEGRNNRIIGTALASAVIKINKSIVADKEHAAITSISRMHDAPQRRPTEEDMEWARETMKKIENGEKVANLDKKYAREYTTCDFSDWGDTFEIEIQTFVLGELAFVGLPCETYSEIGLRIKNDSPYENTFVVSLSNTSYGYMAPDFLYGSSAYPARFSPYTARTGKGIADVLVNGSVTMLNDIKNSQFI